MMGMKPFGWVWSTTGLAAAVEFRGLLRKEAEKI
jgi:hypothetical protein